LEDASFEVARVTRTAVDPGLRVLHGPDGHQAAAMVASALDSPVTLVQRADLAGRTVIVEHGPAEPDTGEPATGESGIDEVATGAGSVDGDGYEFETEGESSESGSQLDDVSGPEISPIEESAPENGPFDRPVGTSSCSQ
jgi:hypothetical protein